ncbi:MAG: hypothetical protein ACP5P4_16605 [Steroidobacteraceae bacterium]
MSALVRINHRLQARVEEFEANLRVRDERIVALHGRLNSVFKVS